MLPPTYKKQANANALTEADATLRQ